MLRIRHYSRSWLVLRILYVLLIEWVGGPDEKIFGSRWGRKDELAGAHLGLISHAGVFRGACISSLPTSSPKDACMRGKAMSCVLIESQIFSRQPYLTQSISILSYGRCVFEFFWRSENASMAAFAPFFKEPMISCHSFGKPVNCIWTSLQLQSTNIQKNSRSKVLFFT